MSVSIDNVKANVPITLAGVDITASALDVNASFSGTTAARVTASTPLPVDIRGVDVATSALKVNASFSGVTAAKVTADAAGLPVRLVNVSGQVSVTAPAALPVNLTNVSGEVRVSAASSLPVDIKGVDVASSALKVNATLSGTTAARVTASTPLPVAPNGGVNVVGSALNVNIANVSGQVAITAAASLPVNLTNVSGQVSVTAPASLPVHLTNVSGQVSVTAPASLPVHLTNVSGQVQVTAATPLPTLASVSGDVRVTAGNAAIPVTVAGQPLAVSANGGSFAVSAQGAALAVSANGAGAFGASESQWVGVSGVKAAATFSLIDLPASAGSHQVVARTAAKKIRVLDYALVVPGTAQVTFRDASAAGTRLTGGMTLMNGIATPYSPVGKFETAASHALFATLSVGVSAGGHLTYILV